MVVVLYALGVASINAGIYSQPQKSGRWDDIFAIDFPVLATQEFRFCPLGVVVRLPLTE
jgi:hypothetical protein